MNDNNNSRPLSLRPPLSMAGQRKRVQKVVELRVPLATNSNTATTNRNTNTSNKTNNSIVIVIVIVMITIIIVIIVIIVIVIVILLVIVIVTVRYGRGGGHHAVYNIPYKSVAPATRIENRPPECCASYTKQMSV